MPLFDHDCHILPRNAARLADRLEGLLRKLDEENSTLTYQLIDGLRVAVAAGENVEFIDV